jgi:histidinol-phosphate/aromatic aminotransferase/cobyric acid decarboxylase-like protein
MGAQPKATTERLREAVREVLCMARGYAFTEAALSEQVGRLVRPFAVTEAALRAAAEWNLAKGYARTRHNEDLEETEYLITEAGAAKQEFRG